MKPETLRSLVELSSFFHPEPNEVFRRVVALMSSHYPGAMAMINLIDGERLVFREVACPHPLVATGCVRSLNLSDTWCQFSMGSTRPLLIQDARKDAHDFMGARLLGFSRYLGVPICRPNGAAVGTLCILDGQSDKILSQDDVEFLSLLAMRVSAELERERAIQERVAEQRVARERVEELNARLVLAAEEKRRFVTAVVHDLRQPIAVLRTLLHLATDEEDPAERRETLAQLDEGTRRLSGMIDELLDYARLEADQLPRRIETVSFGELIEQVVREHRPEAAARGIALDLHADPDLGAGQTDRARLDHVLRNLLGNAIKFTAPDLTLRRSLLRRKPRVTVRATSECELRWRLEVEDTGIGMDDSTRERIFDEFYQGPVPQQGERGSVFPRGRGLGLTITRRFCESLGGTIAVRSRPGRGSCFTLVLPRDLRFD